MYINVLAMTFSSWKNKVIDNTTYKSHMESLFGTYRGDKRRLTELIGLVGYDDNSAQRARDTWSVVADTAVQRQRASRPGTHP
jgi:hypothetical protein